MLTRAARYPILLGVYLIAILLYGCGSPQGLKGPLSSRTFPRDKHQVDGMVSYAKTLIGTKYQYGGTGQDGEGFDCSGFTQHVFKKIGLDLPREALDQYQTGVPVDQKDLRDGDLVFFAISGSGPTHVGLMTGSSHFIHSPSTGKAVRMDKLSNSYWKKVYFGARRLLAY